MQIAAMVDQNGNVTAFDKDGTVRVYEQEGEVWSIRRTWEYQISSIDNPHVMRAYVAELADWLGECRIILAGHLRGVYLAAFEKFDITFWEVEGAPERFLTHVQNSMEELHVAQETTEVVQAPVQTAPGEYSIDLYDIMQHKSTLTSKEVLLPFLKETEFERLQISCAHVPKWFEKELPKYNVTWTVTDDENMVMVEIIPDKV
ncbi:MAG: Fe-only nitrogenase accessory protein AnfO [Lachnospiraceae bacterium]